MGLRDNIYLEDEYVIALAGNPNSGKTSVFNEITGARQHVGNWPGVTVEKKEGIIDYKGDKFKIVDLPGTYSLGAYSEDEIVAKEFLLSGEVDLVINIVDATNLTRNLYLTLQLLEMGVEVVMALNMYDSAEKKKIEIDIDKIEEIMGITIVKTSAKTGMGIDKLKEEAFKKAKANKEKAQIEIDYGKEVEKSLKQIEATLKTKNSLRVSYNTRWLSVKILEKDEHVIEIIEEELSRQKIERIQTVINDLENIIGDESDTIIAERKYGFINGVVRENVVKRQSVESKVSLSDKIDKIVTHKILGIPIFLLIMWGMFKFTFALGDPLIGLIEGFFGYLGVVTSSLLTSLGASGFLISLFVDGIIGGLGSVLVFIPNIFLLFLAISILEDSGYMSRAAYVMDRIMQSFGLHGKSFIPLLIGFGCNVPGVMATRTLENKDDRLITILINNFMSCSARLPVYVVFAGVFFPNNEGNVIFSLYLLGIVIAVVMAKVFKTYLFKGGSTSFVMELPPYRIPTIKGTLIHMWERGSSFIKKAGTIIFSVVVLIWLLASLPIGVEYASQQSLIGQIGNLIAPLFAPLGLGNWQTASSLIFGILAKEVVVGTLGVVFSAGEGGLSNVLANNFTALSAYSLMVMTLLYTPCIAVLAAIKRETNSWKWVIFTATYTFAIAWSMAFIVYQGGKLIGLG